MKTNNTSVSRAIRRIALFLAAPFLVAALSAQTPPAFVGRQHEDHLVPAPALKEMPFLGVVTRGVEPALAAQVELPPETGLLVVQVLPDSPAAGTLKEHDLLVRLDDQILIEPRQLGVLVRSRKEGDEVKLTFFRAGKQQTARVKLGKRAAPPQIGHLGPGQKGNRAFIHRGEGRMLAQPFPPTASVFAYGGQPGEMRISRFEHKDAVMLFSDDEGRLELKVKDGKKQLTAHNAKNEQIFSGPVETPEERKALPPEVRVRLEKMESTDVRIPAPPPAPLPPGPAGVQFVPSGDDESFEVPVPLEMPLDEAGAI